MNVPFSEDFKLDNSEKIIKEMSYINVNTIIKNHIHY
jgi:hypothetical protein